MPRRRFYRRLAIVPAVLGLAGAVMFIAEGAGRHAEYDLIIYGAVLMLAAIGLTNLIIIWGTREPADAMWRDGYDVGYRAGREEEREYTRPTVVPFRRDAAG